MGHVSLRLWAILTSSSSETGIGVPVTGSIFRPEYNELTLKFLSNLPKGFCEKAQKQETHQLTQNFAPYNKIGLSGFCGLRKGKNQKSNRK